MSSSVLIHPPRARRRRLTALASASALAAVGLMVLTAPARASGDPLAYIVNQNANTVSVLDTVTDSVTATIPVGSSPQGASINAAGTLLYVPAVHSNAVSVISTASNTVTATIAVGNHPQGMTLNPAGTIAYVGNEFANTVSVINTATNTVTATIAVGSDPVGLLVNPTGTTLFVDNTDSANISVINTATNTVTATIPVGAGPGVPAISPNGTVLYVPSSGPGTLSEINTATNTVTSTTTVGAGSDDVVLSPSGSLAYVADPGANEVSVVNTAAATLAATIPVGSLDQGIGISANGSTVYAANSSGNSLSVIAAATNTVTSTLTGFSGARWVAINDVTAPVVTGVSPSSAPYTTSPTVTITGTDLRAASAITFGSDGAATNVSCTGVSCTATAPAGSPGTVDVTVTTPAGTSATSSADQFTYIGAPTVTGVSPSTGPPAGGNQVTITGTNLTGATLAFGATAATGASCSATSCTATAPAGSAGTVDVQATTASGTSATGSADHYTYALSPTITSISPNGGPVAGGNTVTVNGTNLAAVTAVYFGGPTPATPSCTATSCTLTVPASGNGAQTTEAVAVVSSAVSSTPNAAADYTYQGAPTITAISPSAGPLAGGNTVTITGTNLAGADSLQFQPGHYATNVSCTTTSCTVTAPAGTSGTTAVFLATPAGQVTSSVTYGYQPPPTITSVVPNNGPLAGGTTITINGTNLNNGYATFFGPNWATSGFCMPTYCNITLPPGNAGTVNIVQYTPGGSTAQTSADQFIYEGAPTVTSVTPSSGPPAGGNTVTVTGTNLAGDASVTFGSGNYVKSGSCTATTCTFTVPPGTAGTVDVKVTTGSGTSATSPADHYTYT